VPRIAFDFSDQVALVTGGSRGIGRAAALLFAQSGAKVVIGDVDPAEHETIEAIKRDGGDAIFVQTDVTDNGDVKNLIATAVKTYGGLHFAFNNAGIGPPMSTLAEMDETTFAGLVAEPGISAYIAAKHGVIGLSKAAAVEYANYGIRINALAPGLVNTEMTKAWFDDPQMSAHFIGNTPIGRVSQPAEIAGMVLFLCSDLASFAVGQTFVIDGGYTTH